MANKKVLLFIIILAFLSGNFTLSRLNLGIDLEFKYLLILLFAMYLLIAKVPVKFNEEKFNQAMPMSFIVMTSLYFGALLFSVFYSEVPSVSFAYYIDTSFLLVLIFCLVFVVSWFEKEEFFKFTSTVLMLFGLFLVVPVMSDVLIGGGSRGYSGLSGSNVSTRFLFFGLISSIYLYLKTKKTWYVIFSVVLMAGIIFVGSRGGFVGAATTFAALFFVKFIFTKWKIKKKPRISFRYILLSGVVLGVFSMFYKDISRIFTNRFINTTFGYGGKDIYSAGRDTLYNQSIAMIQERPILGHGVHGYAIRTGEMYPHNMALEFMNDLGIFGAVFFLVFVFFAVYLMFKYKNKKEFILSGIPFYMIIVQMFSGSLYDFRFYFLFVIPLLTLIKFESHEPEIIKEPKKKKLRKKYKFVW